MMTLDYPRNEVKVGTSFSCSGHSYKVVCLKDGKVNVYYHYENGCKKCAFFMDGLCEADWFRCHWYQREDGKSVYVKLIK